MKKVEFSPLLVLLASAFILTNAHTREWTSSAGKKLEADYVSSEGGNITLKRKADGRTFTVPLNRFSAADQAWVKEQMGKPAEPKPVEGPFADKITGDWVAAESDGLPYMIYGSAELDGSKKYPLLLALHGKSSNDENGKQVGGWMKTFASAENYAKNPCIIVAPLCYQPFGATGGGWDDEPGEKVLNLMPDLIEGLPVDENRVYIFGYSMGGFGTTYLASEEPKMFAAAIAVAGCTQSSASAFKRKPLWLFHAADDNVVSVDGSRALAEELKRSKDFKFTEFPSGGHGIIGQVFNDPAVHTWLFSQSQK